MYVSYEDSRDLLTIVVTVSVIVGFLFSAYKFMDYVLAKSVDSQSHYIDYPCNNEFEVKITQLTETEQEILLESVINKENFLKGRINPVVKSFKPVGIGYVIIADDGDDERHCPGFILTNDYRYIGLFKWNGESIDEDIVYTSISNME